MSTSLLTSPTRSLFLMCTPRIFAPFQRMPEPTPFLSPFFPPPEISSMRDFNCHHPLWNSRGTSDPLGKEVFDWVISSDLLSPNDPDTLTLIHRSSGSRSSPDISFAPSSLTLSCSWEVLQDLGSDHLPILSSVSLLRPIALTSVLLPSTFRKLAGMAYPATLTPTVLLQRNTRLFPLLLLFLPLWH